MILGCGRSGTSIFGELFEYIPGYTYFSEPDFEEVLNCSYSDPIAIKIPRESSKYPSPSGLSFPIESLLETMPEPPIFFWQVRHPLDAIASLRVGISHNWGHHPRPVDWEQWLSKTLVEQCAHHWVTINGDGFRVVRDYATTCKFEDMLGSPENFAYRICGAIGVSPNSCSEQLTRWADRVQDTNNEKFVEAKTSRGYSRPDHSVRIGRWKENLTEEEVLGIRI